MRTSVLFAISVIAAGQTPGPAPAIVTSDIANFWKAYDASQPGAREEAFQKLYLDRGSPGLQDFVRLRIGSAKKLADAIDKNFPKFYAGVRAHTMSVEAQRPEILKHLERFKELYPEAHFPTVYFVIGRLTSGGTVSDRGLLIGTEVYSLGPDVDSSEIRPSFRKAMGSAERIPLIVVHELTHTQVEETKSPLPPLLRQCLTEGAADFMTELVAGSSINAYMKEWAESRREELFARFAKDLASTPSDNSHWLYNYSVVTDEPADLGYWIGNEICRSFYDQAKDKKAAIREIVTLKDMASIMRDSRYAALLPRSQ